MSVTPPIQDHSTKMAKLVDDCTRDLGAPWRSRNRDSSALDAIELAFRRGYQAGYKAERERITKMLRNPSDDLVSFVAVCIRDGKLGPARAAIGAVCDWVNR